MYLSLKKKDSVTSILLFIFNVFLVEQGIYAIPLKKIFRILEPFHKNESAIRMGLSRGVQNGMLVSQKQGNEVYYLITDEAARGVKYWQETLASFNSKVSLQLSGWNGEWSLLYVDFSGAKGSFGGFVDSIRKFGFGSMGNNLWVSPYDFTGEIEVLAQKHRLEKYYQFRGKVAGNSMPEAVVSNVWPIKDLAERYSGFIKTIKEAAGKLDIDSYDGGGGLPFLHTHGQDFFEIIQDDPQLPIKILPPDWPGLQAAKLFLEIRGRVLPKASNYISRLLSQ